MISDAVHEDSVFCWYHRNPQNGVTMKPKTVKRFLAAIFLTSLLLNACSSSTGITIKNAWARPAIQDGNAAVYFLLQNHSAVADELIGVSSDAARAVEIHESQMEGDVMQMRQIASVPIRGKESIEFGPGGYHVMLIGLKQELRTGDEIQVTLHFRNHEDLLVNVPVQEMAPGDDSMSDH
jgi:periplasmic copper chaperone A